MKYVAFINTCFVLKVMHIKNYPNKNLKRKCKLIYIEKIIFKRMS